MWLSRVSSTKLSLELIIYCICLHIYSAITSSSPPPPPYQYPPSSLIGHVTSMVESHDPNMWGDGQKQWVDLLIKYQQLLADCSQAEVLLKLGLGMKCDVISV